MYSSTSLRICLIFCGVIYSFTGICQQKMLTVKDAVQTALDNYSAIKAKNSQLNASKADLKFAKSQYLPDLSVSAQQDYGTINGQNGPSYGYRGLSVSSSGPAQANQSWNAAFGALYLANVNWDFFAFGRSVERVKVQKSIVNLNESDYNQERFQHEVRVAGTYLNLLAAQRLREVQERNLKRAQDLRGVVVARVKNGLNPGVDSALANAEVSSAAIALTNAQQTEQEQSNLLAQYMGIQPQNFSLDSIFVVKIPPGIDNKSAEVNAAEHPLLKYYQNRIGFSKEQIRYFRTQSYPTFSIFSVYQGRASGFKYDIASNPDHYTTDYGNGVDPTRFNYLIGLGVTWNLTSPLRIHHQIESQRFISQQYQDEYNLIDQQLSNQRNLAETRIENALKNYRQAPIGLKAANDAYVQKFTLYKNGLASIVDFTQALYTLNRAETDQNIVNNNVWQALLYKAAATGDFGLFINNF